MSNYQLDVKSSLIIKASLNIRGFINGILDPDSFVETDVFMSGKSFISGEDALGEGVITGYGLINQRPIYLFAQNSDVLKGSISKAHADKIIKAMDRAIKNSTPFISIIDSNGIRVGEGVGVMEGYSALIKKAVEMSESVAHISIIKGNCIGLMSSFAATSDYVFAGNDSVISFNAPMVVAAKEKISGKMNEVFGVNNHKSSLINFNFSDTNDLKSKLFNLFSMILEDALDSEDDPNRVSEKINTDKSVASLLNALCDNGQYLEYDSAYAKDVVCAYAKVNGIQSGIIATNKAESDFVTIDALDKMKKFLKTLENYQMPLITLVNSKGLKTCMGCELSGASVKAAEFLNAIASADISKIGVIVGDAIGFSYSALVSKGIGFDYSLALSDSVISPILPETAVSLFSEDIKDLKDPIADRKKLENKYCVDTANPFISAKDGYIDNIIEAESLRPYVASALLMVLGI